MSKRLIGLTGGIACGKTTVSNYLAEIHKIPILDADVYAKEAVMSGSPILGEIRLRYGDNIIALDGNLNRRALAEIIFKDPQEKIWLESKIHPYVRQRFQDEISKRLPKEQHATHCEPTLILVIPLLFEANMTDLVNEIWVVFTSKEEQIKRLEQRDNLTHEEALLRIKNQLPIEEKIARADKTIYNGDSHNYLFQQIDQALNSFKYECAKNQANLPEKKKLL